MRILIAGAGIGGLSAALCLEKAGHEVKVFEPQVGFDEIGAGIQCGANALRVMGYLGLLDQLQALAVTPENVLFRDYQSGETLYDMRLGQTYTDKYGAPYYHLHRADLHKVLVEALARRAPSALELNAGVTEFIESPTDVSVTLSDGRVFQGDCLVGADGIRSIVRRQMHAKPAPLFTGNVAWRAVVPVERLPVDWMHKIASNFVGPNKHAVLYYLRKQRLANLVGVVENKEWTEDSWVVNSPWAEMKADFEGWHPTVQAIIDAADKDQCYRWALFSLKPFKDWSSKRVTLLGDAAHATLPFMASGAALAIEDGRILARALGQAESLASGLQLYQRNRFDRTARVQATSAQFGKIYHLKNKLMLKAAFGAIRMMGGKGEAFLPEYDANTVPLK
jgi:salicylate hydroxylase